MAKERNRHGEEQQIYIIGEDLWKAFKKYLAEKTEEPFEYCHYGFMFAGAREHFERIGFFLEWHRDPKVDEKSYWAFTMPRIAAMYVRDFR